MRRSLRSVGSSAVRADQRRTSPLPDLQRAAGDRDRCGGVRSWPGARPRARARCPRLAGGVVRSSGLPAARRSEGRWRSSRGRRRFVGAVALDVTAPFGVVGYVQLKRLVVAPFALVPTARAGVCGARLPRRGRDQQSPADDRHRRGQDPLGVLDERRGTREPRSRLAAALEPISLRGRADGLPRRSHDLACSPAVTRRCCTIRRWACLAHHSHHWLVNGGAKQ